jgi:hypothetical protein
VSIRSGFWQEIKFDGVGKVDERLNMSGVAKHQAWADVAVFEDLNTGKALETFLTGKGLSARTYDDKLFRYFLFLRPPRVTYRLQVRQDDAHRAHDLLVAGAADALSMAIHCPSCASLHVSYPQMTRKFILPTVALHLGIIFRLVEHECYCEKCHFIWYLPGQKAHPAPKITPPFPFSAAP